MEPESDNGFVFEAMASDLIDTESGYLVRICKIWTYVVATVRALCYHTHFAKRVAGPVNLMH